MKKPKAIQEYEKALKEYFGDKSEFESGKEAEKKMKEFMHWYNFERKQSDTGKTPAQMWEDAYNEKPKEAVFVKEKKKSKK